MRVCNPKHRAAQTIKDGHKESKNTHLAKSPLEKTSFAIASVISGDS
jgi:hypothetical protein